MSNSILVINAGSSSIKYELIDMASELTVASGIVERIGEDHSTLRHKSGSETAVVSEFGPVDHAGAMARIIEVFDSNGPALNNSDVAGVGHRVVMGGPEIDGPVLVDDHLIDKVRELSPLAPLHNPANLAAINAARHTFPDLPHVAVFDTAFFHDLPAVAAHYAIDPRLAREHSIRRYGFHGVSHEYVSGLVRKMLRSGSGDEDLRQVVLHLGNGASASAVVGTRPVDTSMGFTPLEGLVMGTRSGDIDPSVAFYLCRHVGMSIDDVDALLNRRSGLRGMAGTNDMRDVHSLVDDGDAMAELALGLYVRRLQKYIGAFAAVMGGIDSIAFTAGVGENDTLVRSATIEPLGFLGAQLDQELNDAPSDSARIISLEDSPVTVLVVPTREELSIARQTVSLL